MIFLNNLFGGGGDGSGSGTDYVNGNITVTLPKTEYIHGDTFNTSGAVVTYTAPDGTETDVTSAASFDPSNGSSLTIDGENTVRVSYTPSGKETVYATQIITVEPVPESLTVVLRDNAMRAGESISYKSAYVIVMMTDRTEKDVTNSTLVWSPLEGTVQDNDGNVSVTCSYTENGVTVSGSTAVNVTDKILTGITLSLGQTQYYYGDSFDTTNTVVTAKYDDGTTANVKSRAEFLPENRSELTEHGNQAVVCTYTENRITKTATGTINVKPIPTELTVTWSDAGFDEGDYLSYSNAKVTAKWSDGTTSDITKNVTWDPEAGTVLRSGTQTVTASYEYNDKTYTGKSSVIVSDLVLTAIGADFTKKAYREGDSLDLTGLKVTAMYENGSTNDVTNNSSASPSDGSTLQKDDTKVTISYSESGTKATKDVAITVAYVTELQITGLATTYDATDLISYDGVKVTAVYSDGYTEDVTESVSWSPSESSKLETTDKKITVTYRTNSNNTVTATQAITVNDIPTRLEVQLADNDFEVGDSLKYSGASIVVTYASGKTVDKAVGDVTWEPAAGTKLKKQGTQYVKATYSED